MFFSYVLLQKHSLEKLQATLVDISGKFNLLVPFLPWVVGCVGGWLFVFCWSYLSKISPFSFKKKKKKESPPSSLIIEQTKHFFQK
jgi:hypothetical protein